MEIFNYFCEIFQLLITTAKGGPINFKAHYIKQTNIIKVCKNIQVFEQKKAVPQRECSTITDHNTEFCVGLDTDDKYTTQHYLKN